MVDRHAEAVVSGNGAAAVEEGTTDGGASLATSCKDQRPEPCFKQHMAVGGRFKGAKRTGSSTGAIPGGRRASTEKRRSGTGCAAPCGAVSET